MNLQITLDVQMFSNLEKLVNGVNKVHCLLVSRLSSSMASSDTRRVYKCVR